MKLSTKASAGERLREAPFPFQQTYNMARTDRGLFVQTLLKPFVTTAGIVTIELIVFEPRELIWYLRGLGIASDEELLNRAILTAESRIEVLALLECALGQWADFTFTPSPEEFALYADHDEYTTIFANSSETLVEIRSAMHSQGFNEVDDWVWTGPRSPGTIQEGDANA